MLGREEPAQSSVVPCALAARLFPRTRDRRTNFLTVEGTPRGRRIRGRTQVRNLCLKDCFYFILGCWRRKRLSREPPSCILLGGRSRFWREDWQDAWEGSSLKPCNCSGHWGLLKATLLRTDPGRRGPACFDGGRCHQALHLFSRSLGSQRLGPPGIFGRENEIWICLPLQTFPGIHRRQRRCHWA